jgi:hypothetical protein
MARVNFGGEPAGGVVRPGNSDLLLAQAGAMPPAPKPAAKRASGARTAELRLGGHPVTAVPLGSPDSKGQTTYAVTWRGVTVQAPFTGQLSAAQFKPGSWLKGALERALRESQSGAASPASPASPAAPAAQGRRSGPAPVLRIDLESPAINERAARDRGMFGTKVFVPYVNPDYTSGQAAVVARESGYPVRMWTEPAPNWHTAPKAHAIVDLPNTSEGGKVYARMNHQEVGYSGNQGTLRLPPGASKEFKAGYQQESGRIALQNMVAIGTTLVGAAGARGGARSGAGGRRPGGPNVVGGARTQVVPTGRIEVSNGGRPLPPARMGQPAERGRPATAPPPAAASRPLAPAEGSKGGGVIDVEAMTVSTQPVPRPSTQARPKPLPSAQIRRQPEAPPPRNQPVVRQAAEWPEALPTPRAGKHGAPGRPGGPPALPPQARPAPTATTPGLEVAGGATRTTRPTPQSAGNGIASGRWVVQQQRVQQPNQGPVEPKEPLKGYEATWQQLQEKAGNGDVRTPDQIRQIEALPKSELRREPLRGANETASGAQVVPIQIIRDKDGAISVKMSRQALAAYNDLVVDLPGGQLAAMAGTEEGKVLRALLLQELHDSQAAAGASWVNTPEQQARVTKLRWAMDKLSRMASESQRAEAGAAPHSVLHLPPGGRPAQPLIQVPPSAQQVIQLPSDSAAGLIRLDGGHARGPGLLLLPKRTPFWEPNGLSTYKPGDKVLWTVQGAPDTVALFVPDIHGHQHLLDNFLNTGLPELARRPERHKLIVFGGDYINKGPESYGVVERVRTLSQELGIPVVALRGNHEGSYTQPLFASQNQQAVDDGYMSLAQDMLGTRGFDLTVNSYQRARPDVPVPALIQPINHPPDVKAIMKAHPNSYRNTLEFAQAKRWYEAFQTYWLSIVPPEHTRFFEQLQLYHQQPGSDFSYFHSSGNPRPGGQIQTPNPFGQSDYNFMWERPQDFHAGDFATGPLGGVYNLGGHTMEHNLRLSPYGFGNFDLGTFPTGRMAGALITPDMLYIIQTPHGEPATVMSAVEAIETGRVDTGLSKDNVIPNIRRAK